jgi:hypothetical protein
MIKQLAGNCRRFSATTPICHCRHCGEFVDVVLKRRSVKAKRVGVSRASHFHLTCAPHPATPDSQALAVIASGHFGHMKFKLILLGLVISLVAHGQETIKGLVYDKTGPTLGVMVTEIGTDNKVITPFTGLSTYFELRYEQAGGAPLSVMGHLSRITPSETNVQVVIGFKRR